MDTLLPTSVSSVKRVRMSRAQFELVARAIREYGASSRLAEHFADALSGTNPRFDRYRFVRVATEVRQ